MSSIVELKWRGSLMLRISMSWWSSLDYDTRPLIKQISTSFHDQSRIITSIFYSSCVLFAIKNMNEWVHGKKFFVLLEVGEFWTTTIFFEITQKKMCSCSVSQASLQHFKCHFFFVCWHCDVCRSFAIAFLLVYLSPCWIFVFFVYRRWRVVKSKANIILLEKIIKKRKLKNKNVVQSRWWRCMWAMWWLHKVKKMRSFIKKSTLVVFIECKLIIISNNTTTYEIETQREL